jgi:hypothetical protein
MSIRLEFSGTYTPPHGTVNLDFGSRPGRDTTPRTFTLAATLGPPASVIEFAIVAELSLQATLPAPQAAIELAYDINVYRGPSALAGGAWQQGADAERTTAAAWRDAPRERTATAARWEEAAARTATLDVPAASLPRQRAGTALAWTWGLPLDGTVGATWRAPPRADRARALRYEYARPVDQAAASPFAYPPRRDRAERLPWQEAATLDPPTWALVPGTATWLRLAFTAPWQYATWPPYGLTPPPSHPGEPPPLVYVPDLALNFRCPPLEGPLWILNFAEFPCPPGGIIVPIKRVYIVLNSALLTRVADGAEIPAAALALAIDTQSFAWELRATLAGSAALDMVRALDGNPVEVEAQINGQTWRALIDRWSPSKSFATRAITVSGRSKAAYLAAPYAQPRTYTEANARNAQQLAAQELPTGWTLDWTLTDWLVPAGAWSYQDKTPIEAIAAIAAAAGGTLQAHQSTQTLIVAPRYPTAPWDWPNATPDLSLPADVLTQIGSDWQPKSPANKIYVSGREQGILVGAKRTGTAGDKSLPMIVDPLMTEVAAARARATAELAAAERQSTERLALPLDPDIAGLILPGTLIEVTGAEASAWRGLVRSTSINAALNGNALAVGQQIEIERHYPEAA